MTDSKDDLNDLASQYLDLWQKQMTGQSSNRVVEDTLKATEMFSQQMGDMMQSLNTPEKMQDYVGTWAETWKTGFEHASNQQKQTHGTATASPSPGNTERNVDELESRIALLEERVRTLESRLKDTS